MTTPEDPFQPPQEGATPPPPPQYGAPPPAYTGSEYGQMPAYGGQPPGGHMYGGNQLASWGWRALGYLIDVVIIVIPSAIIGVATGSRIVYNIVAIIGGLTIGYLNGAQGQSPGKRAVGLKLLRESDGRVIGGGMGIVRQIAHVLDTLACLIGWLWPLWDSKRQTFADKVIGTVVIKV